MGLKTYDPAKVMITLGGVPITGFADGTFVSVEPAGDRFTKKVGADGEVSRTKSNDNTSRVTLTLKQTSLSNTYLNTLKESDRLLNAGVRPLSITDLSGTTILFWPQAWVAAVPGQEFGKEEGDRAWVIDTGQAAQEVIGGHIDTVV
jgi:hypothetical protein